jgi:hypothetical protein
MIFSTSKKVLAFSIIFLLGFTAVSNAQKTHLSQQTQPQKHLVVEHSTEPGQ